MLFGGSQDFSGELLQGQGAASASPSLIQLMAMDEPAWKSFSRGSAVRRAGRAGLLRNVAVVLGNWGSPESAPALVVQALSDDEQIFRARPRTLEPLRHGRRASHRT